MSYKIVAVATFRKDAKRLIKKYPSLQKELQELGSELSENPVLGTPIGHSCYKIRLSIASKGKGKSGGARVITYVFVEGKAVYLLSVFDKSEQGSISNKELLQLLKEVQ